MKRILFMLSCLVSVIAAHAQRSLQFNVLLDGTHVVPPNTSATQIASVFGLENRSFRGSIAIADWTAVSAIGIYRSSDPAALGTLLYNFTPGTIWTPYPPDPGGRSYDIDVVINETQIDDLSSGYWYVVVSTDAFPAGELRGQIVLSPKPLSLNFQPVAGTISDTGLWDIVVSGSYAYVVSSGKVRVFDIQDRANPQPSNGV